MTGSNYKKLQVHQAITRKYSSEIIIEIWKGKVRCRSADNLRTNTVASNNTRNSLHLYVLFTPASVFGIPICDVPSFWIVGLRGKCPLKIQDIRNSKGLKMKETREPRNSLTARSSAPMSHQELYQVMSALMSPDNALRKEAEAYFLSQQENNGDWLVEHLATLLGTQSEVI